MARISAAAPDQLTPEVSEVFKEQEGRWGSTLEPFQIYARRPSIFLAVRGMWKALAESGLIPPTIAALVYRRVASINGCPF